MAFVVTGFDGLLFELIWIRLLSGIFGTTIHATSTTIAAFLGGLGIGAFTIGRYADRRQLGFRELIGLFAICEGLAGAVALLLSMLLPRLQVLGTLSGHGDLNASVIAGRALITFVLLFVPAFLMGGGLPVLSKALLLKSPRAGATVGLLYAINTLGAAGGAVLIDAWFVINLGIARTAILAGTANIVTALLLYSFLRSWEMPKSVSSKQIETQQAQIQGGRGRLFLAIYAVSGFCALAYEVAWSRILLSEVIANRFAISTMLAVVLLGLVAGAAVMAIVVRRRLRITRVLGAVQALIGVSAAAGLYLIESQASYLREAADAWVRLVVPFRFAGMNLAGVADCLPHVIVLQGIPSVLLGCVLPLIAEGAVPGGAAAAGRSVGLVYLWNTIGAITGALAAAFLFLPLLGMEGTVQLLVALNLLLAVILLSARDGPLPRWSGILCGIGIALLFAVSPKHGLITRKEQRTLHTLMPGFQGRTLHLEEGLYETLAVREYSLLGVPVNRRLMTNFYSMSGVHMGSNRYMRLMAHLPLLLRDEPRSAAVIAFGAGNTARAVAEHPVTKIEVVDISRDILQLSSYFAEANRNVLADPRVETHVNDGRNYLLGTDHEYDLITFEPPPPGVPDVVGLYTREYYELVRSRLTQRGLMTQWLPIMQTTYETNLSMLRSVLDVFPHVTLWTGALDELIVCAGLEPLDLDFAAVDHRIQERNLDAALREIGVDGGRGLMATFLGGREWIERLTEEVDPVTDDNRLLEYDHARKSTDPSRIRDYFNLFQSNEYVPGLEQDLQDDVRQLCIWRLQHLMGTIRDPDFIGRLLDMTGELHNLYLADAMLAVPWPAHMALSGETVRADLLRERDTLMMAIWHHLLRHQLGDAARLTQMGIERWPGDTQLEAMKMLLISRARHENRRD